MPVTAVDFSCRLPVVTGTFVWPAPDVPPGVAGETYQGGFITFPAAQFTKDVTGEMHDGHPGPVVATTATPVLYGDGDVPFYDRPQSRWVPAPARQALPDGSAYAYTTDEYSTDFFTVHVVDVASGNSRSLKVRAMNNPAIADYGAAGVYIVEGSSLGGPSEGVWLLDPLTGSTKLLRQVHKVWEVRNGYAWVARFDARDKTVWPPGEGTPANSLVRVELATGAETIWFYRPGTSAGLFGMDSLSRPIVQVAQVGVTGLNLLLLDQPGSSGQLVTSSYPGVDYVQGDGDRLWLAGPTGYICTDPIEASRKSLLTTAVRGRGIMWSPPDSVDEIRGRDNDGGRLAFLFA